ncbi:ABATE domain-containing protein [uncultured Roseibium sp.]|uniref:CGNR zinc finger domain-containing protein n=1 Tax=uncultured Roseibium sp. TaxID=1936171 RepID=UPI00262EB770|nr:ABATE domain-containing protein [uncultured Roseibium sp.]
MSEPKNPPPILIADHPALDFLNSVGAPHGTQIEWISDGTALLSWMTAAGLLSEAEASGIAERTSPNDLDETAAHARELREWFRDLIVRQDGLSGWQLAPDEIDLIGRILSKGTYRFQLQPGDPDEAQLQLSSGYETTKAEDLLVPIAHQIAALLSETDCRLTRNCGGPTCTFWFSDITKNKKRRWCDMKICGNRAKTAAFRERKKQA